MFPALVRSNTTYSIDIKKVNLLIETATEEVLANGETIKHMTPEETKGVVTEFIVDMLFKWPKHSDMLFCPIIQSSLRKIGCVELDEEGVYKFLTVSQ